MDAQRLLSGIPESLIGNRIVSDVVLPFGRIRRPRA